MYNDKGKEISIENYPTIHDVENELVYLNYRYENSSSLGEKHRLYAQIDALELLLAQFENPILYKGFHTVERIITTIKGRNKFIEKLGIKSAVGAYVTDSDGKIGLVQQFRPCVNEVLYEIPAGLLDKDGKAPMEILIEELEEECGINRNQIHLYHIVPIADYYMICGSSDATMQIFRFALNTVETSKEVDDADVEKVIWVTTEQFKELYKKGMIKDAKTLMVYFYHMSLNN